MELYLQSTIRFRKVALNKAENGFKILYLLSLAEDKKQGGQSRGVSGVLLWTRSISAIYRHGYEFIGETRSQSDSYFISNKQLKVSLSKWSFLLTIFKITGGPELQHGHIVISSDVSFYAIPEPRQPL